MFDMKNNDHEDTFRLNYSEKSDFAKLSQL